MIRALGPGSVSSFLKVILDVFYYLIWIAVLGVAAAILLLLLISFDPQLLSAMAHVSLDVSAPAAALQLVGVELYAVGVMVIVQRLRRIFGAMTAGDPFQPENVRRLRVVALVLALLEIDRYAFAAIDHFVLRLRPRMDEGLNLTAWFAVLVIVVLAEVFREGARLRREAELTI